MTSFVSTGAVLSAAEVERFSRQMIVEGMNPAGMQRILHAHVACIGLGGLGSTAALYLVAGGVGTLTFIDPDTVDKSNLHRQVIHNEKATGQYKVHSAREACLALHPCATIHAIPEALTVHNAEALLSQCDVIVDCSDNVATRYLTNDIAVFLGKPLVSGAAVRWDGQLAVYHYQNGPCYRCIHPIVPPPATVNSCSDVGVMGPVPGMIGCLQALETLKILAQCGSVLAGRLFVFDGLQLRSRVVTLRGRQDTCLACGEANKQKKRQAGVSSFVEWAEGRLEYNTCQGCQTTCAPQSSSLSCEKMSHCTPAIMAAAMATTVQNHNEDITNTGVHLSICVDVRAAEQYDMAHLPYAHSLPLAELQRWQREGTAVQAWSQFISRVISEARNGKTQITHKDDDSVSRHVTHCDVYLICRRGVASLQVLELLQGIQAARCTTSKTGGQEEEEEGAVDVRLINVDGGLNAYHKEVDRGFPYY